MRNKPDDPVARELSRVTSYLRELVSYRRREDLREALAGNKEKRSAYELSDGSRSSSEVKDDGNISVSARSVQRWWKDWIEEGLAERLEDGSVRARYDAWVIDVDVAEDQQS